MSEYERLAQYPDISFIESTSLETVQNKLIADFQDKYKELTGAELSLSKADPIRLILYSAALAIYQGYQHIDFAGKMGFLKYSYGDYLDNLGALKGVLRNDEMPAMCTCRFTLSAVRTTVTGIPQGTRITTMQANIYFETEEYAEIPAGDEYVDVVCVAQTSGEDGNGVAAGELCVLVDPIPYIASVENLAETSGGIERESDDSLAERIYLAPANYSVAGPEAAYIYFTKMAYSGIQDVRVTSPSECEVDIRVTGENGTVLSAEVLQMIEDYINSAEIKPMTDRVTVGSPDIIEYNIDFTYYINQSDMVSASGIQQKVSEAVNQYVAWQAGKIGRDIEPGKLIEYVMAAGAKRVVVNSPVYTVTGNTAVPHEGTRVITYGGLESD